MIYDFGSFTVTDNTQEVAKADYFLLTRQNEKYLDFQPTNILRPRELIQKLGLDALRIVGVTGTNGKTTTAAAIYSMLNDLGHPAALQGTRGFFVSDEKIADKSHTTPPIAQTIHNLYEAKSRGATHFVMEVSSHAIAQERIEDLVFALKVFTNLSQDHLDYHKSMENYAATKSAFFADETPKLINKEDPYIRYNPKSLRTYAVEEMATYKIAAYSMEQGISALLQFGSETVDFHSPLLGLFNLYNITAAIGAVHMLTNAPLTDIADVVENFGGVRGRMEIVHYEPLIVIDFAHTPDGMQKVFESFPGKNIVALFGAGGDRDRSKRPLMGQAAAKYCKRIYLTSDNLRSEDPKQIIADIRAGITNGTPVVEVVDRAAAIERALDELQEDEILLVLGKGDEEYIDTADGKIPFSDRAFIESLLKSS